MPSKAKNSDIAAIKNALKPKFAEVKAYRYNSASIRVRIIDGRFGGHSRPEREELILPLLEQLPEDVQSDITMLLLLTPDEMSGSLLNLEFEDPSPSML